MTDSDIYAYIKKKVQEGIDKDIQLDVKNNKIEEEMKEKEKFLIDFWKKHKDEFEKYHFHIHPLSSAFNEIEKDWWMMQHMMEMCEDQCEMKYLKHYREGHHTTGSLSFGEIAEDCNCSVKDVKKYLQSLEKDGWIGKMKFNGFFPYWWYVIDEI